MKVVCERERRFAKLDVRLIHVTGTSSREGAIQSYSPGLSHATSLEGEGCVECSRESCMNDWPKNESLDAKVTCVREGPVTKPE